MRSIKSSKTPLIDPSGSPSASVDIDESLNSFVKNDSVSCYLRSVVLFLVEKRKYLCVVNCTRRYHNYVPTTEVKVFAWRQFTDHSGTCRWLRLQQHLLHGREEVVSRLLKVVIFLPIFQNKCCVGITPSIFEAKDLYFKPPLPMDGRSRLKFEREAIQNIHIQIYTNIHNTHKIVRSDPGSRSVQSCNDPPVAVSS